MLSTFPTVSPYESMLGNPFPAFDPASPPWECHDHQLLTAAFQLPEPAGLDVFQSPKPVISSSSSDDRDETEVVNTGPDEPNRKDRDRDEDPVIDERKRRRMESNRESARRSRMRKQKHLENLRNLVNKLRVENRELSNRLRFTVHHVKRVRTENDQLQTQHTNLRQKLLYSRQVLIFRQFQREFAYASPYNSFEQQQKPAPTITQSQYIINNNNLVNC